MKLVTKPFFAILALIAFIAVSLAPAQRFLTKPSGDRKTIYFSQIITALTVNSTGTGTIAGTALTAAAAATSYEYVCVSTASTGTWLRIR